MSYYYRGSRPMSSGRGRGRGSTSRGRGTSYGSRNPFLRVGRTADGMEFDPKDVFQIGHPEKFSGDADVLHKPSVLGGYSVDSEREVRQDQSMLHTLDTQYIPEKGKLHVQLDLNKGCDKFNRYTGNHEEIFHSFLKWILNNQECVSESSKRLTADFISVRSNLTKIMKTPYNSGTSYTFGKAWTMYATEFKGSVYIRNCPTKEEKLEKEKPEEDDIFKWGHVFEHYMGGGDPEAGVNANEEYRVVLNNTIGEISLLFAPKVDCVDPEQFKEDFKDMEAFVLVKCCRELMDSRKKKNHKRYKLSTIWCENQLAGIPRTILGYRTRDGIVHTLELLETDDLPEISEGEWDPNVCFNFLVKFLNFVKERVHSEPGTAFKFDYKVGPHSIYCSKLSGKDNINLLPGWYTDGLFAEDES